MWNFLDLIFDLLFIKDASDMAKKAKDDPPNQRKWRWVAVILLIMMGIGSAFFVLVEIGLFS